MGGQDAMTLVFSVSHNLSDPRFLKRNGFDHQTIPFFDGGGHTFPYSQRTDLIALPQQIDEKLPDELCR
jgi:hypothetical protein